MKKTSERIERVMVERLLTELAKLKLITKDEYDILLENSCGKADKSVYEISA